MLFHRFLGVTMDRPVWELRCFRPKEAATASWRTNPLIIRKFVYSVSVG